MAKASTNQTPDSARPARPATSPAALILFPFVAGGIFYGAHFLPNLDPNWRGQLAEVKAWVGVANNEAQTGGGFAMSGSEESPKREPIDDEPEAKQSRREAIAVPVATAIASTPQTAAGGAIVVPIACTTADANTRGPSRNATTSGTLLDSGNESPARRAQDAAPPAVSTGTANVSPSAVLGPALSVAGPDSPTLNDGSVANLASAIAALRGNVSQSAKLSDKHSMLATNTALPAAGSALATLTRIQPGGSSAYTWNGGTSSDWGNAANWGGTVPGSTDTASFANLISGSTTPTLVSASQRVGTVTFASAANGYTITGNSGYSLTVGSGGITQASGNLQSISVSSLVLGASQTWAENGTGGLTVSAPISGSYSLTKAGNGTLTLSGTNTFTGGLTVNAGTLTTIGTQSAGSGAVFVIGATTATDATVASSANTLMATTASLVNVTSLSLEGGTGAEVSRYGTGGTGGAGGAAVVNISGAGDLSLLTTLTLQGGIGGEGVDYNGTGGAGGAATLILPSSISLPALTTLTLQGGAGGITANDVGGPGGTGGAGGASTLSLPSSTNLASLTTLTLEGGTGGFGQTSTAGAGGASTLNLLSSVNLSALTTLTLQGGAGGAESEYGLGGVGGASTLNLSSSTNLSALTTLTLKGGIGGVGLADGTGGTGGAAMVNLPSSISLPALTTLTLQGGTGGNSAGGRGGGGGAATLSLSSSANLSSLTTLTLQGGTGGTSTGGTGGAGGAALLSVTAATTATSQTNLVFLPGSSGSAANGATGGVGGKAIVDMNGYNLSVGGLDTQGVVTSSAIVQNTGSANATLTVGGDNATHTFGGVLQNGGTGSLSLVKTGTGILTLTGASTFTGGTSVQQGTLAATGTALGTGPGIGLVSIASGATLGVGEAANTKALAQATSKLTIGALSVMGGSSASSIPSLTFNLGANNTSDTLALESLAFSGSSAFNLGFASATGGSLGAGTYDLLAFTTPSADDVVGLDTSTAAAANADFKAFGAGNLSGALPNGTFAWTFDSSGNVSGLTFAFVGTSASMPEPPTAMLVLLAVGLVVVIARLQVSEKDAVASEAHDGQSSSTPEIDLETETPQ